MGKQLIGVKKMIDEKIIDVDWQETRRFLEEKYFSKIRELSKKYDYPCENIAIDFNWVFGLIEKIEQQLKTDWIQCKEEKEPCITKEFAEECKEVAKKYERPIMRDALGRCKMRGCNLCDSYRKKLEADKWIPCEVEMPKKEYGTYWIAVKMEGYPCFYYCSAVYTSEHGFRTHDIEAQGKIVAWQPIQLYKKEGAE